MLEGHAQRCNLDVLNFDEGRPERAGHGSETLPSSQGLIAFAGFSRIKSTRGANTGTSDSPCAKAIDACAKLGYVAEAEKLFQEMQARGHWASRTHGRTALLSEDSSDGSLAQG